MRGSLWTTFVAAIFGGLVVAAVFVALGFTGRRTTVEFFDQSPVDAQARSSTTSGLTPHAIYLRDAPAVVFVKAEISQQVNNPFNLYPQHVATSSTGSGFLVSCRGCHGDVLTNYHLIEGADPITGITVEFADDVARRAVLVRTNADDDLALLRVDMTGVPRTVQPLTLGNSTGVRVGDPTLAIGNPFGLDRTLTSGIVSALQRQIQAPNGFAIDNVIQTDAPIDPGNSGGPLIDGDGKVIGINSQIETADGDDDGSIGIAFAIPIDTAEALLPSAQPTAVAAKAYLGVSASSAAAEGTDPAAGVPVDVAPGGPAARAGLRDHDTIEAIDGRRVRRISQVEAIVFARAPGARVSMTVKQGRRVHQMRVVLGSRSGASG